MALEFLFVCTGNICRSPVAEALFTSKLLHRFPHLFPFVSISSAGVSAIEGGPPTQSAIQSMDLWGIDIEYHRATALTRRQLAGADLIITMAREHILAVERLEADAASRTYTLKYLASFREQVIQELGDTVPREEAELHDRFRQVMALVRSGLVPKESRKPLKGDREAEFGSRAFDIMDPVGGSLEVYLMVAEDIDNAIEALMDMFCGREKESE
jgi:protein-tyrosine phosphatase